MIEVPAGHLYLGEHIDGGTRERNGTPVLLEAADLTTHGVVVGMTGSGKTGLGVVMLEEALLQGIPCLILDPKGDLPNLLLTFPELRPEDFAPWVEEGDPAEVATSWREGLGSWGIEPARLQALRDAAEYTIYTPGSRSGVPLNIVGSLRRPEEGSDAETVADEVEGFVSGLLNMVGVESDPLSGREHILLSNLIEQAWAAGQDLDLAQLVGQVQNPPLRKLGVYELDDFFPPADRTKLAMTLNGLLASRSFAAWAEGPDLDLDRLLASADGTRPACAIVSLAHLSDEERQFVVSLLLGKLVTWMRRQSGTSKLRALVYFDEVMGFVPPNGAPPAKKPILTLFKQARAFGVGLVLATQNPVDVDYKGLSNAGTWMIGRLQTEQDKARLLDGLTSAGGDVDVQAAADTISSLGKREFMLRAAGKAAAQPFTTRWAMSYLRGPLTRDQIATLMADRRAAATTAAPAAEPAAVPSAEPSAAAAASASTDAPAAPTGDAAPTAPTAPTAATTPASAGPAAPAPAGDADTVPVAPKVAEGVPVRWLDPAAPWLAQVPGTAPTGTTWAPALVARVALLFDDTKLDVRHTEEWEAVYFPLGPTFDPAAAIAVDHDDRDLRTEPAGPADRYALTDAPIDTKRYFSDAEKAIADHLYRHHTEQVLYNRALKLAGRVGESPEEFAARCAEAAEAAADADQVKLEKKFAARIDKARDALGAAADRVAQARAAEEAKRTNALVEGAGALLGAVLGGRRRARSMARGMTSARQAQARTEAAMNDEARKQAALAELERDLADELAAIDAEWREKAAAVETVDVALKKSNIRVTALALTWFPVP
ncbi:MAG TPA: DUF87 domain-containing protein [Acidimicrobiales bacterium]